MQIPHDFQQLGVLNHILTYINAYSNAGLELLLGHGLS